MGGVSISNVPEGYAKVEADSYSSSNSTEPVRIAGFAMSKTPVTNDSWKSSVTELGDENRFVLLKQYLRHPTQIIGIGATPIEAVGELAFPRERIDGVDFNGGEVLVVAGSLVLLQLIDAPSAKYDGVGTDGINRKFSGLMQPVVGINYYHGEAWMLIEGLIQALGEDFIFVYPTDKEYFHVASNRGTHLYGTPNGELFAKGKKQIHVSYLRDIENQTADVDDPRYPIAEELPMGIQTTGNVNRWMSHLDPTPSKILLPYGSRGGSWAQSPDYANVHFRLEYYQAQDCNPNVGFSPVIVSQTIERTGLRVELYSRGVLERLAQKQTRIARGAAHRLRALR